MGALEKYMICCSVGCKKEIHKDSSLAWNQMEEMGLMLRHMLIRMWRNQQPMMVEGSFGHLRGTVASAHLSFVDEPTPHLQPFVLW
jgi:hypothetical protein